VDHVRRRLEVSLRRACKVLGVPLSTYCYQPRLSSEEEELTERINKLAVDYGRYGYRRITALLQMEGWKINHKRVERIWRTEGLKVPQRQPKRRRLWFNDGSCIRLRPEHPDHVWSYDFVQHYTHDGRKFRILTILDEYTRQSLAIDVERRLNRESVLDRLTDLFIRRGVPEYIRSDNGSEFAARGEIQKAIDEYKYIPEDDGFLLKSELLRKLKRFEEALETTKKMQKPKRFAYFFEFPLTYYHRGLIYEDTGNAELAIKNYESLLELWKDGDKKLPIRLDAQKRLSDLKKNM